MKGGLAVAVLLAGLWPAAALAQERQWTLDTTDDDAFLTFGVPETDDVGVSFWCPRESGEIRVFVPETDAALKPEETISYTIAAAGENFAMSGRTMANEEAGSVSIESTFTPDAPILAALLKADRFTVKAGTSETIYPLIDADLEGLQRFCRKP